MTFEHDPTAERPLLALPALLAAVRACTLCAAQLPAGPRPVLQAAGTARILIAGQAPGRKVHATGLPFDDASGDRLRQWLGLGACRALGRACAGASFGASLGVGEAWDCPPQRAGNDGWHRKSPRPFGLKLEMGS